MVFAHDTELSLQAAVAIANSALEPDTMTTVDELWALLDAVGPYSGRIDRDEAELAEVQALRSTLRTLLNSDRDTAVERINALLAEHRALPRLVRHGDMDWHLHAVDDEQPLAVRIAVESAMAMVDVVRSDEMSRLGVCADDDCDGIVLDLSRNRSRIFCSTTCGNRAAVAAYRARQA